MGKLIQAAVVAVAILLGYYYFFGNEAEKTQAQTVTTEVKQGVVALKNFVVSQKDKADIGAIKANVQRAGAIINDLSKTAVELDQKYKLRAEDLLDKQQRLQKQLEMIDQTAKDAKQKKSDIEAALSSLVTDIDNLTKDVEQKK